MERLKKVANSDQEFTRSYQNTLSNVKIPEVKKFLLEKGGEDITTEKSAQTLVTEVYDAYDKFRLFLKQNKDLEMQLNMNSANLSQDCWETYVQNETSYEIVWECDEVPTEPVVYNIDRADVEAMQQITAGIQVYLTALIAYDLSGTKNAHLKFRNRDVSSSVIFQTLIQNKDFGKLRDPRFLKNIKAIGTDYASAVNWALKIDKELCPAGRRERNSRPGKVFSEGLCLFQKPTAEEVSWGAPTLATQKTKLMDTLKIIETVASGNPLKAFYGEDKEYSTEILWSALIDNPIKDIRSIGINFNRCNQISSVKDESVNGLMPNNDANFVLKFQDSCN